MKKLKKKVLQKRLPAVKQRSYYDPKTGIMTLTAPGEPVSFGEALAHGLQATGGKEGFADWGRHNPGHMYTLLSRTLPLELAGKAGGPIEVTFVDPVAHLQRKEKSLN